MEYTNVDKSKLGQQLLRQCNSLFASPERTSNESNWAELSEYLLPNQFGNFQNNKLQGVRNTKRHYDPTGATAVADLAATIHTLITNQSINWSKFQYGQDRLNNDINACTWLEDSNRVLFDGFSNSNFYTEVNKGYQSLVGLANMALLVEESDPESIEFSGLRFKALHMSQLAWAEGLDSTAQVVYWKFKLSARNAHLKWGDLCGKEVIKACEKNPEQLFEYVLCIYPRDEKEVVMNEFGGAEPTQRPFAKVVIDKQKGHVLEEGGYFEFPIMCVRWETLPEEVYGRGRGHLALNDVKSLSKLNELALEALAMEVHPPLAVTHRSVMGVLNYKPKSLIVMRNVNDIVPMKTGVNWSALYPAQERLVASIKSIFFIDKLIFPPRDQTGEMTATEVVERINQMQKVLGPTLGRINSELLTPLIERVFKMMLRKGAFGELPAILKQGRLDINIKYINPLARSQRIEEVQSIEHWVRVLGMLAQLGQPEALDNIDVDGVSKLAAKIHGVPESAIRDPEKMKEVRDSRAKIQQQKMQEESAVAQGDAASKMAKAQPKTGEVERGEPGSY